MYGKTHYREGGTRGGQDRKLTVLQLGCCGMLLIGDIASFQLVL